MHKTYLPNNAIMSSQKTYFMLISLKFGGSAKEIQEIFLRIIFDNALEILVPKLTLSRSIHRPMKALGFLN